MSKDCFPLILIINGLQSSGYLGEEEGHRGLCSRKQHPLLFLVWHPICSISLLCSELTILPTICTVTGELFCANKTCGLNFRVVGFGQSWGPLLFWQLLLFNFFQIVAIWSVLES